MSKDWPRLFILLAISGFFAFRWWTLGGAFHALASIVYLVTALAGIVKLPGGRPPLLRAKHQMLILNVGISLVFLDLVFAQIEWDVLLEALAEANYWMLLPSSILVVISLFLRTWRWQWLLRALGRVPFGPAFRATNIGIGANIKSYCRMAIESRIGIAVEFVIRKFFLADIRRAEFVRCKIIITLRITAPHRPIQP